MSLSRAKSCSFRVVGREGMSQSMVINRNSYLEVREEESRELRRNTSLGKMMEGRSKKRYLNIVSDPHWQQKQERAANELRKSSKLINVRSFSLKVDQRNAREMPQESMGTVYRQGTQSDPFSGQPYPYRYYPNCQPIAVRSAATLGPNSFQTPLRPKPPSPSPHLKGTPINLIYARPSLERQE
jgi:hypothetical protein